MRNSSSFGLRRVLLIAVVGVFMLTLMVSGVSAVTGTFDPVSPGSGTAPGPNAYPVPNPLSIVWDEPTTDVVGDLTYEFNIKESGDVEFTTIPVDTLETTVAGGEVTWTPNATIQTTIQNFLVEGEFEWNVTATDDMGTPEEDDTTATSTSFFFVVDLPDPTAPSAFELDGPPGASVETGAYLRELPTDQPITWTPSEGAEDYTFHLFQISNNTRIGEVIVMPDLAPAGLGCAEPADELCTLTADLDALNLTTGQYAWTVVAVNEEGETEASNAPYYFQVNIDPVELVRNGGFEAPVNNPTNATPAQWKRVNPSGERRECRENKLPAGYSGACAYKGTGGPAVASLVQKVPGALVKQLAIGSGDSISVNALVQSANEVPANSKIVVTLVFAGQGSPKQNINVALANTPGETFSPISSTPTDVDDLGNGTVKKITVKVVTKSKLFIDDVSVVLNSLVP